MFKLNNAEIAFLIWIGIFLIYNIKNKAGRSSTLYLLKSFFQINLIKLNLIFTTYILFSSTVFLYWFGVWNYTQIKSTLFWSLFTAFPLMFKAVFNLYKGKNFLILINKAIKKAFTLTVIFTFFINKYPFPLLIELLIAPIVIIEVYFNQLGYKKVSKLLTKIFILFVAVKIIFVSTQLIYDFNKYLSYKTILDFLLPLILYFIFIPYLYLLKLYSEYELFFVKLDFAIDDIKLRKYVKIYSVFKLNFSIDLLNEFKTSLNTFKVSSKDEFKRFIKTIIKNRKIRKFKREEFQDLWKPTDAECFLEEEGLKTTSYHYSSYSKVYYADMAKNDVAYYIEGSEDCVKSLRLKYYFNYKNGINTPKKEFLRLAEILYNKTLGVSLPDTIIDSIMNERNYKIEYKRIKVIVEKDIYLNNTGFSIAFTISHLNYNIVY